MAKLNQVSKIAQNILMIVPCYNEEDRFDFGYFQNLVKIQNTFWIFVDDGSTDRTGSLLSEFCNDSRVHFLKLPSNVGKSEAIRFGILEGRVVFPDSTWVGFLDSDGAFNITDIRLILEKTIFEVSKEITAVFSSRVKLAGRKIQRRAFRHFLGRAITTLYGFIWETIPYDAQSGFKVFRNSESFQKSIGKDFSTRWFFDIEISIRIGNNQEGKLLIWEEPLLSWTDIAGSKISSREILRLLIEIPKIGFLLLANRKHLNLSERS